MPVTLRPRWRNLSLEHRLLLVVGVMATLIVAELLTLRFAMHTMSAVRAFVTGEGLWSKAQKNAAFALQRYATSHDEADYEEFLLHLEVPEGDRRARLALLQPEPDLAAAREGFLAGGLHDDDVTGMIDLIRRFGDVSYLAQAIEAWTLADQFLEEFRERGLELHHLLEARAVDQPRVRQVTLELQRLNEQLTEVEDEFSRVLGEGSRWLDRVILTLLLVAVLLVETIGLSLTLLTGRRISRGLHALVGVADALGQGRFGVEADVGSRDEIGRLGVAINRMGEELEQAQRGLEARVAQRTEELSQAVRVRDDFLSIASHELKTPLATLRLLTQGRKRLYAQEGAAAFTPERLRRLVEDDARQVDRLVRLVEDLLDISKLTTGRFELRCEPVELAPIVEATVDRLRPQLEAAGYTVRHELDRSVNGTWDGYRVEQVLANLLMNALKYGGRRGEVRVTLARHGDSVRLAVSDEGDGIAAGDHARIFERYERVGSSLRESGLGLGLYISREIAAAHGGTLDVESAPGRGATFVLTLPLAAIARAQA